MVKHVILWKLKEDIEDPAKVKREAKETLEALVGKVPGLLELKLIVEGLETSNCDMMLDSTLESFEALKGYAVHPDHVAAADGYVRPFTSTRLCMDYEIE